MATGRPITPPNPRIDEMLLAGSDPQAIIRKLDVTYHEVNKARKRLGIKKFKRGTKLGNWNLPGRNELIHKYRAEGQSLTGIANYLGMRVQAVWAVVNRDKYNAGARTRWLVKMGKLIRPETCSKCGLPGKIEGHHDDYSKPEEVRWLCKLCHVKLLPHAVAAQFKPRF